MAKMKLACFVVAAMSIAPESFACSQLLPGFRADPSVNYSVAPTHIDNRVTIEINGVLVTSASGNGPSSINQSLSEFLQVGENKLVITGYNAPYQGGHDPNPAQVNYVIRRNASPTSDIASVQCSGPDNRGSNEKQFFQHIYNITLN